MNFAQPDLLRAAYYCAAEVMRHRSRTGQPLPAWLRQHFAALDAAVRMSRSGHGFHGGAAQLVQDEVTAQEAADMLGCSKRQALRLAADLDGRLVGGRWLFPRSAVEQYAAERNQADV
ncbi:hypothetical protein NJB1507_37700 [Mycobacterium marinum]|uniref:helix-turn-helix domain-containing protein n=1 Tax=Mycobacterium marinum TaxID=1781 RepID=UPI0021C46B07|nr:helix-turn-helix domain-containing protein [Mycobacterium marinum]GJO29992.1 hypothetical protein NJB1507_37700 [Mycobacterium marinum]